MNKGSRILYHGISGTVDDIVFVDGLLYVIATLDDNTGAAGLGTEFTPTYRTSTGPQNRRYVW